MIVKTIRSTPYTLIPTAALNDKRLSLDTLGMLAILYTLQNDKPVFLASDLINMIRADEYEISFLLNKLVLFGYLEHVPYTKGNKPADYYAYRLL